MKIDDLPGKSDWDQYREMIANGLSREQQNRLGETAFVCTTVTNAGNHLPPVACHSLHQEDTFHRNDWLVKKSKSMVRLNSLEPDRIYSILFNHSRF